jgi:hypothetical protein
MGLLPATISALGIVGLLFYSLTEERLKSTGRLGASVTPVPAAE